MLSRYLFTSLHLILSNEFIHQSRYPIEARRSLQKFKDTKAHKITFLGICLKNTKGTIHKKLNPQEQVSEEGDNVEHHDVVKMLHLVRKYHFDDTCVCFTTDADIYLFIQRLLKLLTIQYECTYNLKKMIED